MVPRCLGHRAPLLWIALPYLAGLIVGYLASDWIQPAPLLGIALLLMLGAAASLRMTIRAWAPLYVSALIAAGTGAYPLYRARLPDWERLPPREARLVLRVDRIYARKDPSRVAGLAHIEHAERHLGDLVGQPLYFSLAHPRQRSGPPVGEGSLVRAVGLFSRAPARAPKGGFEAYLCAQGINFRLARGRLLSVERPPSDYRQFCIRAAERFRAILGIGLEGKRPALAGVLRAMLLGQTGELSEEQNAWFMRSGTMHLFAISGLHITSMALVLRLLSAIVRIPDKVSYALVLGLLWLYVDITGASPSALRAFLMVAVFETARLARQPVNSVANLSIALLAALAWNPLQVFQIGFQMSYAIVAVLLLAGLPLSNWVEEHWRPFSRYPKPLWRWWHRIFDTCWHWFCGAFSIGIATLAISLFFGVCHFHLFTPGALLANLVLIPISDWVLFAGLASLAAGLGGVDGLALIFNHAAGLLLWLMEWIVQALLHLPGAALQATFRWDWLGDTAIVALLALSVAGYASRWSASRVGWWAPAGLAALVLGFGIRFGAG